jgi:hypothetical protein
MYPGVAATPGCPPQPAQWYPSCLHRPAIVQRPSRAPSPSSRWAVCGEFVVFLPPTLLSDPANVFCRTNTELLYCISCTQTQTVIWILRL